MTKQYLRKHAVLTILHFLQLGHCLVQPLPSDIVGKLDPAYIPSISLRTALTFDKT